MCKVTMPQDFLGQKSPPGPLWTGKHFAGQAYGNMLLPDSKTTCLSSAAESKF